MGDNYEALLNTSFKEVATQYLYSLRSLLALSDEDNTTDLECVRVMNNKMNSYLEAMIKAKKLDIEKGIKHSFKDLFNLVEEK